MTYAGQRAHGGVYVVPLAPVFLAGIVFIHQACRKLRGTGTEGGE